MSKYKCNFCGAPKDSILDGLGNGIGYGVILIIVSMFREILGSGELYGYKIIPESFYALGYMNNGLMLLAPGAFIILGLDERGNPLKMMFNEPHGFIVTLSVNQWHVTTS